MREMRPEPIRSGDRQANPNQSHRLQRHAVVNKQAINPILPYSAHLQASHSW